MKFIFLFLISLNFLACSTQKPIPVAESKRAFISDDLYAEFKSQIPDFPIIGSAAQKADEAELRRLQKSRSKQDCERASTEVVVTLQSFYGKPYGPLSDRQVQLLFPFFEKMRIEGGQYIGQVKRGYSRLRPYDYLNIKPCLSKEPSYAYPSGHATLATMYAMVLTDLFPQQKTILQKRSEQIAQDRILGGVHHPTDIQTGNQLGEMIYNKFTGSKFFADDVQKYKELLAKENLDTF